MGILGKILNRKSLHDEKNKLKESAYDRDDFIKKYIPFIVKTISKTTGRYVQVENDIYFSIGLEAFNNAINTYEPNKGKFISYAGKIISCKIIDEMRRERAKLKYSVSLEDFSSNGEDFNDSLVDPYCDLENRIVKSEEIDIFKKKLKEHKVTFQELLTESPKHKDTRQNCYRIARCINDDAECRNGIWNKGKFLRKRISTLTNASEKVLKSNRKFIIASAIIIIGKLDTLIQHMDFEGGEDSV